MNLLTHTRPKSACPSLSLPAGASCPAEELSIARAQQQGHRPICSDCYATKRRYRFKHTRENQLKRHTWWLSTPPEDRAVILADAVKREGCPTYFRCYDSGDLDIGAMATWLAFADLLPRTVLWIPTRTWILPMFLPGLAKLNSHPRITVRPSACGFDDPPPVVEGLSAGLASHWQEPPRADWLCPGNCTQCRTCWDHPEMSVSFPRR